MRPGTMFDSKPVKLVGAVGEVALEAQIRDWECVLLRGGRKVIAYPTLGDPYTGLIGRVGLEVERRSWFKPERYIVFLNTEQYLDEQWCVARVLIKHRRWTGLADALEALRTAIEREVAA